MRSFACALVAVLMLASAFGLHSGAFNSESHVRTKRGERHHRVCLHFAMKHNEPAKEALEKKFWAVSDPVHEDYGKHLSIPELTTLLAPSQEDVDHVSSWVKTAPLHSFRLSENRDHIHACMPVDAAEQLLGTEFHHYKHASRPGHKHPLRAAMELRGVPESVASKLDYIGGANTPIHDYRLRSPQVKRGALKRHQQDPQHTAELGSEVSADSFDSAATSVESMASGPRRKLLSNGLQAPVIVDDDGGVGQMQIWFQLYCPDGSRANTTLGGRVPCSESTPVDSIEVIVTTVTKADPDRSVSVLAVECRNGDCNIIIGALKNFLQVRVKLRVHFADGRYTPFSAWSKPTTPHEWATVQFLKELYGIPATLECKHPNSSQAVVEFEGQYFSKADLAMFFHEHGIRQQKVARVVGFNNETEGSLTGGESQLDIQYIMGIAVGARTWFWSVEGVDNITHDEPFLKWQYEVANQPDAPLVHSVSYSDDEALFPAEYSDRINVELQKMGLRGMTVLVSSGDDGCHGTRARTDLERCTTTHPEFPASSPYVLSVGATSMTYQSSPLCQKRTCSRLTEQPACANAPFGAVVTSGGGFSNRYMRPPYQDGAVNGYLRSPVVSLPANENGPRFFNEKGRGYPDIAGYGNLYLTIMNRDFDGVSGTSASTPLLAAIITLWNDLRLMSKQPPLGFVNPFLYKIAAAHPDVFNDGLVGDNRCTVHGQNCCPQGFTSAVGWDPVTGLGTPRFLEIAALVIAGDNPFPFLGNNRHIFDQHDEEMKEVVKSFWLTPAAAIAIAFTALVALVLSLCLFCRFWKASAPMPLGERTPLLAFRADR